MIRMMIVIRDFMFSKEEVEERVLWGARDREE